MSADNKFILLVDDEPEILELLQLQLEAPDRVFLQAENGRRALDLIFTNPPDLIVSDYNMPKLDGVELLKILKERQIKIPVIWITGRADRDVLRNAWRLGVFDYFEKPYEVTALEQQVSAALGMNPKGEPMRGKTFLNDLFFESLTVEIPKKVAEILREKALLDEKSLTTYIEDLIAKDHLL